ncbi:MAG TPA: hypothetical protein PLA31_11395, partial [Clostridia bacterium]|nr:hypothetical protein [Clostridia bacterium]
MLDISEALRAPGAAIPFRHLEPLEPMDVLGQTVTYPEPAVVEGFFTLQDVTLVITAQPVGAEHRMRDAAGMPEL